MIETVTCVFCRIVAGDEPARFIHRSPTASAFLPRAGWLRRGHTLVVPNRHSVGVQDADRDDLTATIALVQEVALAMHAQLGASGVNILNASGAGSGQSVGHLHFHVVPRRADDGVDLWPRAPHVHVDNSVADELAAWFR